MTEAHSTDPVVPVSTETASDNAPMPIDPLKRVFLPLETSQGVIRTVDGRLYLRGKNGSIKRARPKAKGKAARRAEREAKRLARGDR